MSIELTNEREREVLGEIYLVGGSAHPDLTNDIAHHMGVKISPFETKVFDNGEGYVRFGDSVRRRQIFIVQPHVEHEGVNGESRTVDNAIIEQAMAVQAASHSSAAEITVVAPHLGYARQDRRSKGGEPGAAEIPLKLFKAMGADRVVSVDVHSPQTPLLFGGPFDHLTAQPELRGAIRQEIKDFDREQCVVVEPDAGAAKLAWSHAQMLDAGTVAIRKIRPPDDSKKVDLRVYGDVKDKVCILFDDMVDTAGTMASASEMLKNKGALAIYIAATHGLLSGPALERLKDAPIDRLLITDTVPSKRAQAELGDKLKVIKFSPVIAKALLAIAMGRSVSEIFKGQNYL